MTALPLFPVRVTLPPVYRFLWNAKQGPVLRCFNTPYLLDGYVKEIKRLAPEVSLSWLTPTVVVGCFL